MNVDLEFIPPLESCSFAEGLDFDTLEQLKSSCRIWAVKSAFEIYVATFYTLAIFHSIYENPIIHPLSNEDILLIDPLPLNTREIDIEDEIDSDSSSDESNGFEDNLLPSTVRRQPGRSKKVCQDKLKKSRGAIKKIQKCGLCR